MSYSKPNSHSLSIPSRFAESLASAHPGPSHWRTGTTQLGMLGKVYEGSHAAVRYYSLAAKLAGKYS